MRRATTWALYCSLAGLAGALATETRVAHAEAASQPPDVVTTKDDGMYRGTIIEKVPNEYVELTLSNGATKRFDMSEVDFAGSREQFAARSTGQGSTGEPHTDNKPTVTVVAQEVQVKLESAGEPLAFHLRSSSAHVATSRGGAFAQGYQEMCTTPCEVQMPGGTHTFALSTEDSRPVEAPPVRLSGEAASLVGTYTTHPVAQVVGWSTTIFGMVGGLGLMVAGAVQDSSGPEPYLYSGIGLVALGTGIGLGVIWSYRDEARVDVAGNPQLVSAAAPGLTYRSAF